MALNGRLRLCFALSLANVFGAYGTERRTVRDYGRSGQPRPRLLCHSRNNKPDSQILKKTTNFGKFSAIYDFFNCMRTQKGGLRQLFTTLLCPLVSVAKSGCRGFSTIVAPAHRRGRGSSTITASSDHRGRGSSLLWTVEVEAAPAHVAPADALDSSTHVTPPDRRDSSTGFTQRPHSVSSYFYYIIYIVILLIYLKQTLPCMTKFSLSLMYLNNELFRVSLLCNHYIILLL